jgi:hypothetical protein
MSKWFVPESFLELFYKAGHLSYLGSLRLKTFLRAWCSRCLSCLIARKAPNWGRSESGYDTVSVEAFWGNIVRFTAVYWLD